LADLADVGNSRKERVARNISSRDVGNSKIWQGSVCVARFLSSRLPVSQYRRMKGLIWPCFDAH
jgi:hypothetical protein